MISLRRATITLKNPSCGWPGNDGNIELSIEIRVSAPDPYQLFIYQPTNLNIEVNYMFIESYILNFRSGLVFHDMELLHGN